MIVNGKRTVPLERKRGNVVRVNRPVSVRRGDGDFVIADKHNIHFAVIDSADCDFFAVVTVESKSAVVTLVGIPSPARAGFVDRAASDLQKRICRIRIRNAGSAYYPDRRQDKRKHACKQDRTQNFC